MGRYLILEFDENGPAGAFLKQLRELGKDEVVEDPSSFYAVSLAATAIYASHGRLIGVFSKPNALCSCVKPSERSVRGSRFGWWVCTNEGCKRPKNGSGHTLLNMLDDPDTPTRHRELILSVRWEKDGDRVATALSKWEKKRPS